MPYTTLSYSAGKPAPVVTIGAPLVDSGETLASILAELTLELGDRDDYDATRATKWVNWGYRHTCAMLDIQELVDSYNVTLDADQPLYQLPPQVSFIKSASVIDTENYPEGGRVLGKTDLHTYRRLDSFDTGEPTMFFRHGRLMVLWRTPSDSRVVTLDVNVRPDDLTEDNHSPLLPTEWHEALILAAKYRGLRGSKLYKEAAGTYNDFLTIVRPMLDTDAEERLGADAHVQPVRTAAELYRATSRRFRGGRE